MMVILTDQDKRNIANMDPGCSKYCVYPEPGDAEEIKTWMAQVIPCPHCGSTGHVIACGKDHTGRALGQF